LHSGNFREGALNPRWNRGKTTNSKGYVSIYMPDHLKADSKGYVYEHILIAEKAFGKPLPPKAESHHIDGNRGNNAPSNLVVCPDRAYHMLLEQRTRALKACGNARWRKCRFCKKYDTPINMIPSGNGHFNHRECVRLYERNNRKKKKEMNWKLR